MQAAFEVGELWDREAQIDVVGMREDGVVDLGECKWGAVKSPRSVARELEEKVERFPNPKGGRLARRVFLRSPVKAPPDGQAVKWHSLPELDED